MSDPLKHHNQLPPEQQAIRDKCFHPPGTFVEFPIEDVETPISARFEKIVRMYPNRSAVKSGDRSMSYDELNRYANGIAHAIVARRGTRNEPVALILEHGIDAVAAILGILKAGKAYVVLNDAFPKERNLYIAEHSDASLIITNQRRVYLASELSTRHRQLMQIDNFANGNGEGPGGTSTQPDDYASILYTSGSTGQPKGIISTHRNILTSLHHHSLHLGITPDDRLSLLHSLSFGSALDHFFPSLLNGAALFTFDVRAEGVDRLASWLFKEKLTIYHSPPSLFRQLAEALSQRRKLVHLRFIRLSGAPITSLDFELYKKHFQPSTRLIVGMGSSEARGIASAVVDQTFDFPKEGSPIGYPEPGKLILLLDENGLEVPLGEVGEMAVKGRNLNQGYWKQPEQTQAKFLSDPYDGEERIYLTGDLGKKLADGFLIHLGRKDLLVKIRGYRVEIAEVEKTLTAHPLIKESGVVAWEQAPGEKYLAAYVVARSPGDVTVKHLFQFLRSRLPDYMIPSVINFVDSLPLINGKLDRSALPLPDRSRLQLPETYMPPRTPLEQRLVRTWEEILSVRPVGIHDNFFDLGGHSLLATQIVSRIRSNFSIDLPLRHLFESPTVAGMAVIIAENQANRTTDSDLEQMLREVEATTEEDAQKLLGISGGQ